MQIAIDISTQILNSLMFIQAWYLHHLMLQIMVENRF